MTQNTVQQFPTDTELLDWLQQQTDKSSYTGLVVFRWSACNRGWRLHETSFPMAVNDVRIAIADAMNSNASLFSYDKHVEVIDTENVP